MVTVGATRGGRVKRGGGRVRMLAGMVRVSGSNVGLPACVPSYLHPGCLRRGHTCTVCFTCSSFAVLLLSCLLLR